MGQICADMQLLLLKMLHWCFRWLSTQLDDGRICRELVVGASRPLVAYQVVTFTSDIRGAGTDATVHITLHGLLGDGLKQQLVGGPADFERCGLAQSSAACRWAVLRLLLPCNGPGVDVSGKLYVQVHTGCQCWGLPCNVLEAVDWCVYTSICDPRVRCTFHA